MNMRNSVLFLTHNLQTPSTRYRVLQFIPYFEKEMDCKVKEIPSHLAERFSLLKEGKRFDVIFLQKRLLSNLWLWLVRRCARRLIYEFDDAVFLKRDGDSITFSKTRQKRFASIVRSADIIITSNEYLAESALKYADAEKVRIIPNAIDTSYWRPSCVPRSDVRIVGWIGSASNLIYIKKIEEPLRKIFNLFPGLRLKIVCDKPFYIDGIDIINQPFSEASEVEEVLSFDIAIAPYMEDEWTKGKNPVKVLSYMASGLPVVTSNATCTRRLITDKVDGLLCNSQEDWQKNLELLIKDQNLRTYLGTRARKIVEENFSVSKAVERYLDIFRLLLLSSCNISG